MAIPAPLEVNRHYGELSEKETVDVVHLVADLIVTCLKAHQVPPTARGDRSRRAKETQA